MGVIDHRPSLVRAVDDESREGRLLEVEVIRDVAVGIGVGRGILPNRDVRATAVCGSGCCWKRASSRAYSLACWFLDMATRSVRIAATPGIILPLWSNVGIHLPTSVIVTPSFQVCQWAREALAWTSAMTINDGAALPVHKQRHLTDQTAIGRAARERCLCSDLLLEFLQVQLIMKCTDTITWTQFSGHRKHRAYISIFCQNRPLRQCQGSWWLMGHFDR